jgi:hypothetical protein
MEARPKEFRASKKLWGLGWVFRVMATGGMGSKFNGAGADEVKDAVGAGDEAATRAGAEDNSWRSCAAAGSLKNASMAHAMANFTLVPCVQAFARIPACRPQPFLFVMTG